jgi:hypothetical protein
MQTPIDPSLVREAQHFQLRFACTDCVHFEPDAGTCSGGYPNTMHRNPQLALLSVIVFCKAFELT